MSENISIYLFKKTKLFVVTSILSDWNHYILKLHTSSFVWLKKNMITKCLLQEVHQSCISSKMLPSHTTEAFKYWCLIEFVDQVNTSIARTGISFQNNLQIFKLRVMFDMLYFTCNNICSAWKIKEKLKFSMVYYLKM